MGKYDPENSTAYGIGGGGGGTEPAAPRGKYLPSSETPPPTEAPPGTNRTWWDTAKSAGQTAVDFGTAAGSAATFGMDVRRDALAGWLAGDYPDYSTGVAMEQKKLASQRERSPYASIAGDVAGAAMLPSLGGAGLAARYGGGLGARALGYGIEGGVLGAAQGAGTTYTGNTSDYLANAAKGFGIGGVLGAGMGSIFGRGGARSTAEVPTTAEHQVAKNLDYDRLARSGARYEPASFASRADDIEAQLTRQRFGPRDSPRSWQALDEMRGGPTSQTHAFGPNAVLDPGNIEWIHKGLNKIPRAAENANDLASAGIIKRGMTDFVEHPPTGAVLPGTERAAFEASALAARARGNNAAYKRGQMFDSLQENALTAAGSQASGLNVQNKLRQGVAGGLRLNKDGVSPFSKAGYNADEIGALTRFARVPRGDATMRYVDRLFGAGGGLGASAGAGVAGGFGGQYLKDDPALGAALGAATLPAGLALRMVGNRRANRQMNELSDMIRQRSPLYQDRAAVAPMVRPGNGVMQSARDAMSLELVNQQREPLRITVTPKRREEE